MSKKPKSYTADEKSKIAIEAIKGHLTQAEITSKYEVHSSQIYNWKKLLENNAANIFKDKSLIEKPDKDLIEELYNKIGKLNMELEWLKKKSELFSSR
jgi:transposase-like protein